MIVRISIFPKTPNCAAWFADLSKLVKVFGFSVFAILILNFAGFAQFKIVVNRKDNLKYVKIPRGSFLMGCVPGDKFCERAEKPQHKVEITKVFWLTQTEVTVSAFRKCVKETGYVPSSVKTNKGRMYRNNLNDWEWTSGLTWETPLEAGVKVPDDFPVAQVSWDDADAFCRFAGGRLPTEAEWEYASRGGLENKLFPWGDEKIPLKNGIKQSNAPDEATARMFPGMKTFRGYDDGFAIYAPTGSFAPNSFGLFDMAGGVWEWTNDFFAEDYYTEKPQKNPTGAAVGDAKIVRGGSWAYAPEQQRSSERGYFEHKDFWTASLGFRCAARKISAAKK